MHDATDVVTIVKRLSLYLIEHPKASDTAEGIAAWWLQPGLMATPASVEAALGWMVDRGALAAVNAADGRVHYRCRHDRADVGQRLATLARDPLALVADAAHLRRPN